MSLPINEALLAAWVLNFIVKGQSLFTDLINNEVWVDPSTDTTFGVEHVDRFQVGDVVATGARIVEPPQLMLVTDVDTEAGQITVQRNYRESPPYDLAHGMELRIWREGVSADAFDAVHAPPGDVGKWDWGLEDLKDAWEQAYAVVADPATRTPVTIAAKDAAKAALLDYYQPYGNLIRLCETVSRQQKLAMGLNPPPYPRTPIVAPETAPVLVLSGVSTGTVKVAFYDAATPNSRAKPHGVDNMPTFVYVGASAIANPAEATYRSGVRRQGALLTFTEADRGKVLTVFGRWETTRGDVGPWSAPASIGIP